MKIRLSNLSCVIFARLIFSLYDFISFDCDLCVFFIYVYILFLFLYKLHLLTSDHSMPYNIFIGRVSYTYTFLFTVANLYLKSNFQEQYHRLR